MDGFSDFVLNCSKTEMSEKRHVLFEQIKGHIFYNISSWPRDMESLFWRKPIDDQQVFQLLLFPVENGCLPWLATHWILSSAFWKKTKTIIRLNQIQWILSNRSKENNIWFYFDLHFKKYVYLDGTPRYLTN